VNSALPFVGLSEQSSELGELRSRHAFTLAFDKIGTKGSIVDDFSSREGEDDQGTANQRCRDQPEQHEYCIYGTVPIECQTPRNIDPKNKEDAQQRHDRNRKDQLGGVRPSLTSRTAGIPRAPHVDGGSNNHTEL
jgi:hypothetical protein